MWWKRLAVMLLGTLFCTLWLPIAAAAWREAAERRYLDELYSQRRLAQAESYCRQKAADPSLDDRARAFYAVELSRCLIRRALAAPPADAEPIWQAAFTAVEDFGIDDASSPRRLLVRSQAALVALARAQWLLAQIELAPDDRQRREATESFRRSIARLSELRSQVASQSRHQPAQEKDSLRADELRSLANQLAFHQAQAYQAIASLAPADSPDHMDALNQAASLLAPLSELPDGQSLAWDSRLDRIAIERMRRDFSAADALLKRFSGGQLKNPLAARLRAEEIYLALARDDLPAAKSLAAESPIADAPPEFDAARLEVALSAWQAADAAKDAEQSRRWQSTAEEIVERMGKHHRGYWQARAQARLAQAVSRITSLTDVESLRKAAENHYRANRVDDARDAYDRASVAAAGEGDLGQAFRFAFLAATIEHQRRRFAKASGRYRDLALRYPDNAKAAEAHLLSAHDALEQARSQSGASLVYCRELLQEHLRLFPRATTANEARWRLGRLCEHEKAWLDAIDAYRAVEPEHARGADAIKSTVRVYEQLFSEYRQQEKDVVQPAMEAARFFERMAETHQQMHNEQARPIWQLAAISSAKLWLEVPDGASQARRVLARYFKEVEPLPDLRAELEGVERRLSAGNLSKR